MKKAIVIDGNSLIYRAFHATYKQAEWSQEHNLMPVNAIKTVALMLFKILENNQYDYGLIAMDTAKKTLRSQEFEEYKANRKPMDEKLVVQLPYIYELFEYLGFTIKKQEGFEADDFVGSFAKIMSKNDILTEIYSSDRDMLQLVDKKTKVMLIKQGANNIIEVTFSNFASLNGGLMPNQITEYKALVGDSSDNLPGVKGIGPKTAAKILNDYQTLDNIYQQIDSFAPSTKNKLVDAKQQVYQIKELATIKTNLLDNCDLNEFIKKEYDANKLENLFNSLSIKNTEKYYKK